MKKKLLAIKKMHSKNTIPSEKAVIMEQLANNIFTKYEKKFETWLDMIRNKILCIYKNDLPF